MAIARREGGTLLLTADHVLFDAERFRIRTAEGVAYAARLLGRDRASDLALLDSDAALPPLAMGPLPPLGAPVCALGNAFGLGLSVSCGVVSARGRAGVGFNRIEDFLQSDAAINPGMSGGALVDSAGRLVGLIAAIFSKGPDGDIGVNFAISARLIAAALPDLETGGPVAWPEVDLRLRGPPPEQEGPLGPEVFWLPPAGAAPAAGLLRGDRLLRAAGRRLQNAGDWRTAVALAESGEAIPLEIWRDGSFMTSTLTIP
ncbi:MAG: trypsin-like peptidase domain-containing protein [Rhodospirillales bacterium]|nr:trypsin-like peptidase domain-containing protein [Rhodospirillales bacterium]